MSEVALWNIDIADVEGVLDDIKASLNVDQKNYDMRENICKTKLQKWEKKIENIYNFIELFKIIESLVGKLCMKHKMDLYNYYIQSR